MTSHTQRNIGGAVAYDIPSLSRGDNLRAAKSYMWHSQTPCRSCQRCFSVNDQTGPLSMRMIEIVQRTKGGKTKKKTRQKTDVCDKIFKARWLRSVGFIYFNLQRKGKKPRHAWRELSTIHQRRCVGKQKHFLVCHKVVTTKHDWRKSSQPTKGNWAGHSSARLLDCNGSKLLYESYHRRIRCFKAIRWQSR